MAASKKPSSGNRSTPRSSKSVPLARTGKREERYARDAAAAGDTAAAAASRARSDRYRSKAGYKPAAPRKGTGGRR